MFIIYLVMVQIIWKPVDATTSVGMHSVDLADVQYCQYTPTAPSLLGRWFDNVSIQSQRRSMILYTTHRSLQFQCGTTECCTDWVAFFEQFLCDVQSR